MSYSPLMRAGDVGIRVLDMPAAIDHYINVLGLIETGRDEATGRVYLKAWDETDHHSVVLREATSPGMDFMGFKVESAETMARLAKEIAAFGCPVEHIAAGTHMNCGERIEFVAPTGHTFHLYAEKDVVGNGVPTTNPDVWPDGLQGMAPTRFDHCLLYGDDVDGSMKLFTDVLGLHCSEQVMDGDFMIGCFLTCANKPHDIAFIRHEEKGKFHHASFYLDSWYEIQRAADIISKKDVSLDIGPTRHGITRGGTIYFFDPSGNRNEVFSGGYIYHPDRPRLTWTADQVGKAIFYYDRKLNENFLGVVT